MSSFDRILLTAWAFVILFAGYQMRESIRDQSKELSKVATQQAYLERQIKQSHDRIDDLEKRETQILDNSDAMLSLLEHVMGETNADLEKAVEESEISQEAKKKAHSHD